MGDERVFLIGQMLAPFAVYPGKPAVQEEAEAEAVSVRVVFLAHMGEIDVTYEIVLVEADQKFVVSDRNVPFALMGQKPDHKRTP